MLLLLKRRGPAADILTHGREAQGTLRGEEGSEVRKTNWEKRRLLLSGNLVALTTGMEGMRCNTDRD